MSENKAHKSRLLELLLTQHRIERRVWTGLSDEQKNAIGKVDDWSSKDHIIHVTYWREIYVQRLQAAITGGELPPPQPDFLKTNDAVFEQHKDDSWEAVMKQAARVQADLIQAVEAIDERKLADPDKFEWTNGRPLWQYIAFGEGYHPYAHLCDILLLTKDFSEAEKIQRDLFDALNALDDSEAWQGNQRYNLACFYALHERPDRAIELLAESFEKNPDLIDWSKQDSDLDSLRGLPEFQALYPEEA